MIPPTAHGVIKFRVTRKQSKYAHMRVGMHISVIQVRMDQGLVVKIRCPMRS